jgi:peptidoglycan hydrolase FlgJ
MTAVPQIDLSASQSESAVTLAATVKSSATTDAEKLKKAAKEFEGVFLRQMLSALERTTKATEKGSSLAGQQAYGSMVVDAMANAMSDAGGIGLGSVLTKALIQKVSAQGSSKDTAFIGDMDVANDPAAAVSIGKSNYLRVRSQGLSSNAVPVDEIRNSAAQMTGQLADSRIK